MTVQPSSPQLTCHPQPQLLVNVLLHLLRQLLLVGREHLPAMAANPTICVT